MKMCGLSPLTVFTMRILSCDGLTVLNPLGTKSDQHQISPSNIPAVENKVVMRIRDIITQILLQFLILVLVLNGLRSSPRKSILNPTNLCQRHKNVTNVSLSVPYLYTGILIFVHLVGKSLQTSEVIELAVR